MYPDGRVSRECDRSEDHVGNQFWCELPPARKLGLQVPNENMRQIRICNKCSHLRIPAPR